MSVLTGTLEVLDEGRIQGSSIWVLRKDTKFDEDESPPKLDPIIRMDAGQLKVPIREGYIPTPTFPVAS